MTSSWFFLPTLNYDARSTTHQMILFVGKRTEYDANVHIEIPHVRLGIISKMLLLNEQGRRTDKMII